MKNAKEGNLKKMVSTWLRKLIRE